MRTRLQGLGPTQGGRGRRVQRCRFSETASPLNESRQQSAGADELVVQPAVICKCDSGVVVCPWWRQEAEFECALKQNNSGDLPVISI